MAALIHARSGWLCLAVVLDLYSRRIGGWAMAPALPCPARTACLQRPAAGDREPATAARALRTALPACIRTWDTAPLPAMSRAVPVLEGLRPSLTEVVFPIAPAAPDFKTSEPVLGSSTSVCTTSGTRRRQSSCHNFLTAPITIICSCWAAVSSIVCWSANPAFCCGWKISLSVRGAGLLLARAAICSP